MFNLYENEKRQLINYSKQMLGYYEQYANKKNHWLIPEYVQFAPTENISDKNTFYDAGLMMLAYLSARDMGLLDSAALSVRLTRIIDTLEKSETDSDYFLCFIIVLREGIKEYSAEEPKLEIVGERLDKICINTNFSALYNCKTTNHKYFMSEARLCAYYAVATNQAPIEHWNAFNRTIKSGTIFEYFMPQLFLPILANTMIADRLSDELQRQKNKTPWGVSESSYLAFDKEFQYKYSGGYESVISPYSSFLVLPYELSDTMGNLEQLKKIGVFGEYGFFEAIDYTPGRRGVVRAYRAAHIGMSMIACANAIFDNIMQKRFMRNPQMNAAKWLLEEKTPNNCIFTEYSESKKLKRNSMEIYQYDSPNACEPACAMLSNGKLTHFFTDSGANVLRHKNIDITRNTDDLLIYPHGIYVVARAAGETLTATAAPFYSANKKHTCIFGGEEVIYRAEGEHFTISQRFTLEKNIEAERCMVTIENKIQGKLITNLLFYFEPILSNNKGLIIERDIVTGSLQFSGINRDLWLCIGLDKPLSCEFTRNSENGVMLRLSIMTSFGSQSEVELLFCCGKSRKEALNALLLCRREKPESSLSILANDSITARLGMKLLPKLLFDAPLSESRREAILENVNSEDFDKLLLYEWDKAPDRVILDAYIRFWRLMRFHKLYFDICVVNLPCSQTLPKGIMRVDYPTTETLIALKSSALVILSEKFLLSEKQLPFVPVEFVPIKSDAIKAQNSMGKNEYMLLSQNNIIYDLCNGAHALLSQYDMRYEGFAGNIHSTLEIRVDNMATIKYMDVTLENIGNSDIEVICAYSFEPEGKPNIFEQEQGRLLASHGKNCFAVLVPHEHPSYMTNRADFYSGNWSAQELMPQNDAVAASLIRKKLPKHHTEKISFILSAAANKSEALELTLPQPLLDTRSFGGLY